MIHRFTDSRFTIHFAIGIHDSSLFGYSGRLVKQLSCRSHRSSLCQKQNLPEHFAILKCGVPCPSNSHFPTLSPPFFLLLNLLRSHLCRRIKPNTSLQFGTRDFLGLTQLELHSFAQNHALGSTLTHSRGLNILQTCLIFFFYFLTFQHRRYSRSACLDYHGHVALVQVKRSIGQVDDCHGSI